MNQGDQTHVSVVQTWECDSNNHLNIQFLHQRFREAGYLYRQRNGLGDSAMASAHTRFHRELHVDDTAIVHTLPVRDDAGAVYLMHRLTVDGETLYSASLDRLAAPGADLSPRPLSEFPDAVPRGLPAGPTLAIADSGEWLAQGRAAETCITHVLDADLDHAGQWRAERVVSTFSNGGQSVWKLIGAGTPWLRERNLGRVTLELKLDRFASPAPGAVLRQTSHPVELGRKTFRFCHQIEDAITGQLYATGQLLSVLMDHESRKVVEIPPELSIPGAS